LLKNKKSEEKPVREKTAAPKPAPAVETALPEKPKPLIVPVIPPVFPAWRTIEYGTWWVKKTSWQIPCCFFIMILIQ